MTPSLVFTIDTEPDDQWAPPLADGTLPPFTFANTRGLGALRDFFRRRELPATWMTSYSIARDAESARVLREARDEGDEIAGHLHGWETPPYLDVDHTHRPFIGEYEPDVRLAKHQSLIAAHEDAFGARPFSYRAGRWAVDALEIEHLAQLGYGIDSSIPPGIDFRDRFGLRAAGPDFREWRSDAPRPFRLTGCEVARLRGCEAASQLSASTAHLWEVPASIVAGCQLPVAEETLSERWPTGNRQPATGNPNEATGNASLIWIRPLKHPRELLVGATRALLERGAPIVNVMFHSSEAFVGTSPISRRDEDVERLYGDLDAIIAAARAHGAVGRTLSDAVARAETA